MEVPVILDIVERVKCEFLAVKEEFSIEELQASESIFKAECDEYTEIEETVLRQENNRQYTHATNNVDLQPKEGKHVCSICQKSFRYSSVLLAHSKLHSNERPFQCNYCGSKFKMKSVLKRHENIHTKEKKYVCKLCGKTFFTFTNLTQHQPFHTEERPFQCHICNKSYKIKRGLVLHSNKHTKSKTYSSLSLHMRTHSDIFSFECEVCSEKFRTKKDLKSHHQTHKFFHYVGTSHNEQNPLKVEQTSHADECDDQISVKEDQSRAITSKSFTIKYIFKRHGDTYEREKQYRCELCKESFHEFEIISRHLECHSTKQCYECEFCCLKFRLKRQLVLHQVSHRPKQIYKCEFCNKKFRFEKFLVCHLDEHLLACTICNLQFKSKLKALVTSKIKVEWGLDIEEHRLIELEQVKSEGLQIEDETAEEINLESAFSCLESKKKIVNSIELLQHNTTHSKSQNDKCCPPGKSHQSASHSKSKQVQCEICHLHFNMKKELITHKHLHAKKDCELCNKTFRKASLLKRHMKSHSEEHPFECNFCSVKFKWKQHLQDHLNKHTKEKRYECSVCKKTFFYSQNLHGHLLSHSDERPFGCDICRDVKIEMEDEFEVHRDHMIETPLNLKNETNMETDTASINRTMEKYECIFCQKEPHLEIKKEHELKLEDQKLLELQEHLSQAGHQIIAESQANSDTLKRICPCETHAHDPPKVEQFKCEICNKKFPYSENLKIHLAAHADGLSFKCKFCDSSFEIEANLKSHVKVHTVATRCICTICDEKFLDLKSLNNHKLTHSDSDQRRFKCGICNFKFKEADKLKIHLDTHTKTNRFTCEICNKGFMRSYNLRVHLTTHSDERPFECDVCDSKFKHKSSLKEHKNIHTKGKG
ncbi:hypothetical protein HUJ05_004584 [Dendroctonus ponderosae]|nr:hypothetical protein HUJ05_004584 [Dendroctonus ponderosae]